MKKKQLEKILADLGSGRYILEGKVPVPCEDLMTWAQWFEQQEKRVVKQESVGEFWVSTVFLAFDHNWGADPPLLFETMIFRDEHPVDDYCRRTHTWELALEQHEEAVRWAQDHLES